MTDTPKVNVHAFNALKRRAEGLEKVLHRYLAERPAFRSKPIGAPHSAMRIKQEQDIELEDEAKKLLGITP